MPVSQDAESHRPTRPTQSVSFAQVSASDRGRLRWRAIVHVGPKLDASRGQQPLAWHLADCTDPERPEAHCDVGRLLMVPDGNPDGHCQIDGACPRCAGSSSTVAAEAGDDDSCPTSNEPENP
jgi:hypothetical protein